MFYLCLWLRYLQNIVFNLVITVIRKILLFKEKWRYSNEKISNYTGIKKLLKTAIEFNCSFEKSHLILFVWNKSSKGKTNGAKYLPCTPSILSFPTGVNVAVQTGYRYGYRMGYDLAVQVDGDGQHNPEFLIKMATIFYLLSHSIKIAKVTFII